MNYASTNEPENHDNDFPVMTGDDIADMVCGKQEDIVSNEVQVGDKVTVIHRTSKHHLKSGLIVRFTGREDKNAVVKSTQGLGTFTVAVDFLVKQKNAKPVASAPASVDTHESCAVYTTNYELAKANSDLRAENTRLRGDLEAAQAIIAKAGADMQALRELKRVVEAFLDDYGDWMPDQHTIQVSDKSILALTDAFDASK